MSDIILKHEIKNDKYTEYIYDAFDIQNKKESIETIPFNLKETLSFNWSIGVIYGGSGSGKTTILKKLGGVKNVVFDKEKSLISNFDTMQPKDACALLSSVGLSSVPTWLRPFHLLSNGEQYRATMAYLFATAKDNEVILIDEYTSVVDRDVAKAMSFALQKLVRKSNKRIIVASCHYDIMDWLMPDWIYSPQNGVGIERTDCRWQGYKRPNIELSISRVTTDTWDLFKKHHYLTDDMNKSCKCFLFTWNNKLVAFNAIIPQPSGHFKNAVRESRIVVLPEYQGLGLGYKISEFCGAIFNDSKYRYFTKTVHPALGKYRDAKTDLWRGTSWNGKPTPQNAMGGELKSWKVRMSAAFCHEYIGKPISGYAELLLPIAEMRGEVKETIVKNKLGNFITF